MKKFVFVIFLCFLVAGSSPILAQEKSDINLDKTILEQGRIQIFTFESTPKGQGNGVKKRCVGVILIDATPAVVWEYLLQWDSMGEFVPGLEYYKTVVSLKTIEKGAVGESLIEGKLKFPVLTVKYTLKVTFDEPHFRQDWRLVTPSEVDAFSRKGIDMVRSSGGVKNIEGFEYLEPYCAGDKTIYYYAPIVETAVPMPAFVERFIMNSTLPGYMEGVKKRIESKSHPISFPKDNSSTRFRSAFAARYAGDHD